MPAVVWGIRFIFRCRPDYPRCETPVKLNLRFEELASVMSGQSSTDSGPLRSMAQLMLAHKKVS